MKNKNKIIAENRLIFRGAPESFGDNLGKIEKQVQASAPDPSADIIDEKAIDNKIVATEYAINKLPFSAEKKAEIKSHLDKLLDERTAQLQQIDTGTKDALISIAEQTSKDLDEFNSRPGVKEFFQLAADAQEVAKKIAEEREKAEKFIELHQKNGEELANYINSATTVDEVEMMKKMEIYSESNVNLFNSFENIVNLQDDFAQAKQDRRDVLNGLIGESANYTQQIFKPSDKNKSGLVATAHKLQMPNSRAEYSITKSKLENSLLFLRRNIYLSTRDEKYKSYFDESQEKMTTKLLTDANQAIDAETDENSHSKDMVKAEVGKIVGEFDFIQRLQSTDVTKAFQANTDFIQKLAGLKNELGFGELAVSGASSAAELFKVPGLSGLKDLKTTDPDLYDVFVRVIDEYQQQAKALADSMVMQSPEMMEIKRDQQELKVKAQALIDTFQSLMEQIQEEGQDQPSDIFMDKVHKMVDELQNDPIYKKFSAENPAMTNFIKIKTINGGINKSIDDSLSKLETSLASSYKFSQGIAKICHSLNSIHGVGTGWKGLLIDASKFAAAIAGAVIAVYAIASTGGLGAGPIAFIANSVIVSGAATAAGTYAEIIHRGDLSTVDRKSFLKSWATGALFCGAAGIAAKPFGVVWGGGVGKVNQLLAKSKFDWLSNFGKRGLTNAPMKLPQFLQGEGLGSEMGRELIQETFEEGLEGVARAAAPDNPYLGFALSLMGSSYGIAKGVSTSARFSPAPNVEGTIDNDGIILEYSSPEGVRDLLISQGATPEIIASFDQIGEVNSNKGGILIRIKKALNQLELQDISEALNLAEEIEDPAVKKTSIEVANELLGGAFMKSKEAFMKTAAKFKSISTSLQSNAKELATIFETKFQEQGVTFGMSGGQILQAIYETVVEFAGGKVDIQTFARNFKIGEIVDIHTRTGAIIEGQWILDHFDRSTGIATLRVANPTDVSDAAVRIQRPYNRILKGTNPSAKVPNLSPHPNEVVIKPIEIITNKAPGRFSNLPENFVIRLRTAQGSPIGEIIRDKSGLILRNNKRDNFIRLPLGEITTIGRNHADSGFFGIHDPRISGSHLSVFAFNSNTDGLLNIVVKDIGSTNGTTAELAVGLKKPQDRPPEGFDPVKEPLKVSDDIINEARKKTEQFMLTEEILNSGLFRIEKTINIDGKKFHIGPVYQFEGHSRNYSMMMVDTGNGKLLPRLLYQSSSGGEWFSTRSIRKSDNYLEKGALHIQDRYQRDEYGYIESYSNGQPIILPSEKVRTIAAAYTEAQVHDNISQYLENQKAKGNVTITKRVFDLEFFELESPTRKETSTYESEVHLVSDSDVLMRDFGVQQYMPAMLNQEGSRNAAHYFRSLDNHYPQGFIPDFRNGPIGQARIINHNQLGLVKAEKYLGRLNGKPVEWTICYETAQSKDNQRRVWISSIRMANSSVTTYGTIGSYLFTGLLSHKPLDYSTQVTSLRMGVDRRPYSTEYNPKTKQWEPKYDDITPLLDNLLPIRQFRQARGIY